MGAIARDNAHRKTFVIWDLQPVQYLCCTSFVPRYARAGGRKVPPQPPVVPAQRAAFLQALEQVSPILAGTSFTI